MSNSTSLEARIGEILTARKMTVTAAESCTGGLIMHRLTNVPGSSAYLLGGIVVYSNEAKMKFVGVNPETLNQYGAVSEQTALEMARGVCNAFNADVALSVTGIAGPGGGTDQKPVGLTYMGLYVASPHVAKVLKQVWTGDREDNKASSAEAALDLLYQYLLALA